MNEETTQIIKTYMPDSGLCNTIDHIEKNAVFKIPITHLDDPVVHSKFNEIMQHPPDMNNRAEIEIMAVIETLIIYKNAGLIQHFPNNRDFHELYVHLINYANGCALLKLPVYHYYAGENINL